jgi:hypothetical protein
MPYDIVMFPEVAIRMNEEILNNHPELTKILSRYPGRDLEVKVATVAAYCNVAVDGDFKEKELESLFELLYKKLKEKSAIRVVSRH